MCACAIRANASVSGLVAICLLFVTAHQTGHKTQLIENLHQTLQLLSLEALVTVFVLYL